MKKLSIITILFICVCFVCISAADAIPVIFKMTGTVEDYAGSEFTPMWEGERFAFKATIDSNKPPYVHEYNHSSGVYRAYYKMDSSMFSVGGVQYNTTDGGELELYKFYPNGSDRVVIRHKQWEPYGRNEIEGYKIAWGAKVIIGYEFCYLGPRPVDIPQALTFDPDNPWDAYLYPGPDADDRSSDLALDSFDSSPIPEPATMLLLGTGLVGLAGFGRKRFKK